MREKFPLVSVIVPSYNHEKYIVECIESIVNQTYKNIELIVIDDCSTDDSVSIIKKLSEKHKFIFIQHKENKGLSFTRNEGLEIATGKYSCGCASDDYYVLEKIEKQVYYMEKHPQYMISYSDRIKVYENGIQRRLSNKYYRSGNLFEDMLMGKLFIAPQTVMYRSEVFNEVGPYDISLAVEDYDMYLRIAKKFEIGYLGEYLCYYRSHKGNTVNNIEKMESETEKILNKWKNENEYKNAIMKKNLLYFRNYASLNKKIALTRLPINIKILYDKIFYEGLIRLIIPKFIYNIILKR